MSISPRLLLVFGVVIAASLIAPQAVVAQLVSPFGRGNDRTPLDSEDMDLMKKAMREALDKYVVGAASIWESEKTGRAGTAVLTKTFEMRGMRCAQLTHQFTKGQGTTYSAPLCQVKDGTWKLAY